MLHIATVHYASPRWVEIQTRYIRESISVPHQTWTALEKIDPSYGVHFDHPLELRGMHAAKLNALAMEISNVADDDDLLMFIDGDAFPIADPMPLINAGLANAPLVAVRRAENNNEPQPHPCFTVTSVGTWRRIGGDWTAGHTWTGVRGKPTSDVGGNLLRRLELSGTPWVQVLRSNRRDIDPLYFAVYGNAIYHHGAAFIGGLSPVHRAGAPAPLSVPGAPGMRSVMRLVNGQRWRRWERREVRRIASQSQQFYEQIRDGGTEWLSELM